MRRQFRLVVIAAGLALAVATGAAAMVEAAGASGGGPATGPTAQERARELRLQEAVMRVEVARKALRSARLRVEENVGLPAEVPERELDLVRAERALAELHAMEVQRVSLDVKDTPLHATLTKLFEGTDQSVILDPAVAQLLQSVTLTLNDVSLENAVRAICKLHGLEYETDSRGLWVITASPDVARVGGTAFPIYGVTGVTPGSIRIQQRPGGGSVALSRSGYESGPRVSYGGQAPAEFEGRTNLARIGLSDLVDLDVENAPLGEVAAQLGVKRGEEWRVEILVHDAVPEDIRVTAKVYRMRRDDLLLLLAEQTNLDISIDSPLPGERTPDRPHRRVYFVPRPELEVSGPGVGDEVAVLGKYFQYSSPEAARSGAEEAWRTAVKLGRERMLSTGGGGKVSILRSCPQCDASFLLPDWKFCPYCGAEAVAEEEQPEDGD